MKKLLKLGLLSVALMTTGIMSASKKVKVEVLSSNELSITMSEVVEGEVLSISDKKGELVFSEILSATSSYNKTLDFSKLTQGVYYVKAATDEAIKVTPFIIVPDQVKIIKGETKTYHTPVFDVKNGLVEVNINNEDEHEVSITVYANNSSIPMEDIKVSTPSISKTYNFASLPISEYKIVIYQGDYSYVKKVKR
ncbi:T9SS type A sorting domain-containing protein [Aquimarina agarivorans]|uniref:T9SS type A sorting domain-containing protein n=1 Tax=Aquimarina agarivorans TaxID=980584 RepID=UPI000248ED72|nr:T9SS type A sorting domain-containing protein [Aquimarina agarivorans]